MIIQLLIAHSIHVSRCFLVWVRTLSRVSENRNVVSGCNFLFFIFSLLHASPQKNKGHAVRSGGVDLVNWRFHCQWFSLISSMATSPWRRHCYVSRSLLARSAADLGRCATRSNGWKTCEKRNGRMVIFHCKTTRGTWKGTAAVVIWWPICKSNTRPPAILSWMNYERNSPESHTRILENGRWQSDL